MTGCGNKSHENPKQRRVSRENISADVRVAASQTTSCCFGGSDGKTLFMAAASVGKEEEAMAGKVFACR